MIDAFDIITPKRQNVTKRDWERYFPYYAGFSEVFSNRILQSSNIPSGSIIMDPWNGSGTTTMSATSAGFRNIGFDINPVMVVVARSRMLPLSEIDSIEPLRKKITSRKAITLHLLDNDPLLQWFDVETSSCIRGIESSIRDHLISNEVEKECSEISLNRVSSIAATFYIALFSACRSLVTSFASSNPTWIRTASSDADRISCDRRTLLNIFENRVKSLIFALEGNPDAHRLDSNLSSLSIADSTDLPVQPGTVDLVLTSPPYCTRIDYTAATRVELAVMHGLCPLDVKQLSQRMVGSTRVPITTPMALPSWGITCLRFIQAVSEHTSKASKGYYLKTHLDYFDKMDRSLNSIGRCLKDGGGAILVVQDSYYKDVHNDLPLIITEMASSHNLRLRDRKDFYLKRSMSGINPGSRRYPKRAGAVESVLCFERVHEQYERDIRGHIRHRAS